MKTVFLILISFCLFQLFSCSSSGQILRNESGLIITDEMAYYEKDSLEIQPVDTVRQHVDTLESMKKSMSKPVVIRRVESIYPKIALRSELEGDVFIRVWVTRIGSVKQAVIIRTSNNIFNMPVLRAAMKWIFIPAMSNGQPVATWVDVPFKFRISDRL